MGKVLERFLKVFSEISAIPRCSKNEEAIGKWLCQWAKEHNLQYVQDAAGNVLINIPASAGYEDKPVIVLQGHMDMVCEKGAGSSHDFGKDKIKLVTKGEWLQADNTTLGADNGVALAMGLMLAEAEDVTHPEVELLFTVDEETGLTGANELKAGFIKGRILINLDSEDEGKFTIGCAGGRHVMLDKALEFEPVPDNSQLIKLEVTGLMGGHSGVDINKNRGSGIKLLSRVLYELKGQYSINLADIWGGTAHNAISRSAGCILAIYPEDYAAVQQRVKKLEADFRHEYQKLEPDLKLELSENCEADRILSDLSTAEVIDLLITLPHGVAAMTVDIPELVETSCNLAIARIEEDKLHILVSIRSSVLSRLRALSNRIAAAGELCGAAVGRSQGYPAWEPDAGSSLLKHCQQVYFELTGSEPEVLIIHAGLECGVIGEKYPEMEMISFGPTIENAHSPRERLYLPSLERTWQLLIKLLADI